MVCVFCSIYCCACAYRLLSIEQSACYKRQLLSWVNGLIRFAAASMIAVFVSSSDTCKARAHNDVAATAAAAAPPQAAPKCLATFYCC